MILKQLFEINKLVKYVTKVNPSTILIIRANLRKKDISISSKYIKDIKEGLPGCHISLLIRDEDIAAAAAVLNNDKNIDKLLTFSLPEGGYFPITLWKLGKERKFDLVIIFIDITPQKQYLPQLVASIVFNSSQKIMVTSKGWFTWEHKLSWSFLKLCILEIIKKFIRWFSYPFIMNLFRWLKLLPKRWQTIDPDKIKKILWVRLDHIGDVVWAISMIDPLRKRFPKAEIHALVGPWSAGIIWGDPRFSKVIIYKPFWHNREEEGYSVIEIEEEQQQIVSKLCNERYDIAIEPRGHRLDRWIAYCSGARFIVGSHDSLYDISKSSFLPVLDNIVFLTHCVNHRNEKKHAVKRNLDVAKALGCDIEGAVPKIFLRSQDMESAKTILESLGLRDGKDIIVAIHASSGEIQRMWSKNNFISIIKTLLKNYGMKILLVGGPSDKTLTMDIEKEVKADGFRDIYNIAGRTSLTELAGLFTMIDLLVSNDSGPVHIAAAVGTPVVGIYKSELAPFHAPYGSIHKVVSTGLGCSNINHITPTEVIDAVKSALNL